METILNPEVSKNSFEHIVDKIGETSVTVYERLNASNDKSAKEEFVANPNLTHPNNEYGNLNAEEVHENLEALSNIREELTQSTNLTEKQKRALLLIADDNTKQNDFLLANLEYNAAETPEEKAAAIEHHRAANEALYGKPDEDTFWCLLKEQIDMIDVENLSEEDKKEYDALLEKIGPIKEVEGGRYKPSPETVQRFSEMVRWFYEPFFKHIPEEKKEFTIQETCDMINAIADNEFGGLENMYRAEISETAANASVNHESRKIIFPPEEKGPYTRKKALGLVFHEFGTHALRAIPYLPHSIEALSMGMPDNETFDEGVAKCVEQAIDGKYQDAGIDHYINIGLATFANKNFREVYDIQMSLKHLTGKSDKTVLNAVQRCFRGTGELPNNKDLAYYNGANQVWKYIEKNLDNPMLFDNLFLAGKTVATDEEQARLIYETKMGAL